MPSFRLPEKMLEKGSKEAGDLGKRDYSLRIDYPNDDFDPKCAADDPKFEHKQQERIVVTFGNHSEKGEVMDAFVPDKYARDFKLCVARGTLEIVPPKK